MQSINRKFLSFIIRLVPVRMPHRVFSVVLVKRQTAIINVETSIGLLFRSVFVLRRLDISPFHLLSCIIWILPILKKMR